MRILFMGTPDFAASSLSALYEMEEVEIVGVFTQPDKPVGRKQILEKPPVKLLAEEHGTPVFQPRKLRDGTALDIVKSLDPELIAVVAYGRLIPDDILNYPKYGTINIHGSLLPKYRGAAPIQWSVINGEKETGVTAMYLATEMDA
ncbi:MAG: methionyl-tRNA formyltransferase, partial [Oscillospiraceae bacterium]|nr:methionyl-tRNA formyltransferase [Oscillospiraceae bacterium]